ncbi:macrocin-O-methyltransferase [Aureococcus anophagefferens]|nr:macrocin-O-methyltransferase [Aureococcus anophagefferens]
MEKLQRLDKKIHNELQNLDENINKMRDFVDGSRVARKAAPATVGQMSYAHVPTATKSKFADWKQFSAAKRTLRVSSTVSFLCLVDFLVNPATILNRAVQDIVQGIKERKNYLAPNIKYLRNMRMQYQQWEALELEERDWPRREAEQAAQAAKAAYARWANEAAFAAGAALAAERERVRRADEEAFDAADRALAARAAFVAREDEDARVASDGAAAFLAALAASRDEARRELDAFLDHWRGDDTCRDAVAAAPAARGAGPGAFDVAAAASRRRGGFAALRAVVRKRLPDLDDDLDDLFELDGKLLRLAGSVDRLADRMDANAARFSSSTVRGLVENADAPHRAGATPRTGSPPASAPPAPAPTARGASASATRGPPRRCPRSGPRADFE